MFRASHEKLKSYQTCPRRYKFSYLDGLSDKFKTAKPEFTLGQHVHATLKKLLADVPQSERTPDKAKEILRKVWRTNRNGFKDREEEKQFGQRALSMLEIFLQSSLTPQVYALEKPVQFLLADDLMLCGRVDRLDQDTSGAVHLIDYKTSTFSPLWIDNGQLRLYSVLIRKGLELPLVSASYWYLEQNQFVSFYPKDSDLDAIIEEVIRIVGQIKKDQHFPATPNSACKWCEFIDICPAKSDALAIKNGSTDL